MSDRIYLSGSITPEAQDLNSLQFDLSINQELLTAKLKEFK